LSYKNSPESSKWQHFCAAVKSEMRDKCLYFWVLQVNQEYTTLGETALSCAVTRSTPDIARLLLDRNAAGINAKSSTTKETPLVKAVKHGNPQIVRLLLDNGARPNAAAERNGTTFKYNLCNWLFTGVERTA